MSAQIVYIQEQHPNASETFVRAEVGELLERSYEVRVLTFQINQSECNYREQIIQVTGAGARDPIDNLTQAVAQLKPRYLHSHFVTEAFKYTFPVAERLQIPFGFTCHAYDIWLRGSRIEPELLNAIGNHRLCVTAAVEGSRHKDYLCRCGVPEEKIIITPNSVDRRVLPGVRSEFPSAIRKIVTVGRPVPKKGFFVAIDAVRLLRLSGIEAELELIGAEDSSRPLGAIIKEYAANFSFVTTTPLVPHREALERIFKADALLMPSIVAEDGDSDGIPTVLAEAMLMGTPVVATDVGSITDLVKPRETGFIARSGDPAALAGELSALNELLGDRSRAKAFLHTARKHAMRQEVQSSVTTLAAHLESKVGRLG